MEIPFLPDEIFAQILPHLHPDDILHSIRPACKRLQTLATEPLLWRYICINHFKAFSAEHKFEELVDRSAREVDWLALYRLRQWRNAHALQLLTDLTRSPYLQLDKIQTLCAFDYDVKELLIEQTHSDPFQDDGISRAFWAERALGAIHRRRAIRAWMELRNPARGPEGFCRPTPKTATEGLERGHAAFDMFVLNDSWCDMEWICAELDGMANSLRNTVPDLERRTTRDQALILNSWLRQLGFAGLSRNGNYRNLRNCLLGQALRHPNHETIPITSATIYCSIARRLGISADPWFSPGHVIVCVWPCLDRTLDGNESTEGQAPLPMYLDPWGRDDEVPRQEVSPFIVPATWYNRSMQSLAHPAETVLRVRNNIQATAHAAENRSIQLDSDLGQLLSGHSRMNLLAANYASLWAMIILADPHEFAFGNPSAYDKLIRLIVDEFPEDMSLAEQMLGPMLRSNPEQFPPNWKERLDHGIMVLRCRNASEEPDDSEPDDSEPDDSEPDDSEPDDGEPDGGKPDGGEPDGEPDGGEPRWDCELASGLVFRHKRNNNIGLIFRAKMPTTLPSTGKADFYECQYADRPAEGFVVAQQNIEILTDAALVSPAMFPRAGQCFRRFDKEQCRFIPVQASE